MAEYVVRLATLYAINIDIINYSIFMTSLNERGMIIIAVKIHFIATLFALSLKISYNLFCLPKLKYKCSFRDLLTLEQ
jgi:hypothetical protein